MPRRTPCHHLWLLSWLPHRRRCRFLCEVVSVALCFSVLLASSGFAQEAAKSSESPPAGNATTSAKPPAPTPEVASLLKAGREAAGRYQWDEALKQFQMALDRARALSDRVGEAKALTIIGIVHLNTGQPGKALNSFQQALPVNRQTADRNGEAATLAGTGIAYSATGQSSKALDFYQQALLLYRQMGDKVGEAGTLTNIGVVYQNIGQPSRALEYHQHALPLHRQTGNKQYEANTLNNIGTVYQDIGQTSKSLDFYQQALPVFREIGNKQSEENVLNNIGNIFVDIRQPRKALDFYQQALLLCQQIGDKIGEAGTLSNIGVVYTNTGQPGRALKYYQEALPLLRQAGNKQFEANALNNIGMVYRRTGQSSKALDFYQQALLLCRLTGDKRGEEIALTNIGNLYRSLGQSDKALRFYRQSIASIESLRSQIDNNAQARSQFLESYLSVYHQAIELLLKAKTSQAQQQAFLLAQKIKARSLIDRLGGTRNDIIGKLSQDERRKEATLRADCDRLNRAMIAEGVRNEPGSKKRFQQAKDDLAKAEQQLAIFEDGLFARHPDLAARRVSQTASLTEIAAALPSDAALIEFVHLKDDEALSNLAQGKTLDRMVAFVVTRQGRQPRLSVFDTRLSSPHLTDLTRRFHAACSHRDTDYSPLARGLYRSLLETAGAPLARKHVLIVCPDADLWQVPFAVLQDKQGRCLWERYDLSLAYSATGWKAAQTIRRTQKASERRLAQRGTILALADPDFGETNGLASDFGNVPGIPGQRPITLPDRPISIPDRPISIPDRAIDLGLIQETDRGNALRSLPGTRKEATAIQALSPTATLLTGKDAQEATFKKLAPNYRRLHLATHGFFNDASPLLSSLVLAAPPITGAGSEEDGLLTAREILAIDLSRCELAVLSACNTGVGKQQGGEGIIGLTWSLTAAGCPSQVVSGWPVNDASTAQLMSAFYAGLKQGKTKAAALRGAALSLRRSSATRHPYYWAPFFLIGATD